MKKLKTLLTDIPDKKIRLIFYSVWLLAAVLQAAFTNLLYDEAYYWVCSACSAWGHFYYPPLIDPLIQAGYFLFKSELGVRLFFIILSTGGVYLLEKLLLVRDLKLFYAMMLSLVFFQVTSIIAAPDIPLFFLSVSFYLVFKHFLESDKPHIALLLGLNTALLLLTKYHGILLIGFTFLGNIGFLIRKRKTLIWVFSSVLLFTPHILWQIRNGFPTIMFHLFERPGGGFFEWKNLLDYLPGQLLFAGPLISIPLFIAVFRVKRENRLEASMYFNLIAMYLFFFLVSIYHHIEINWTVVGIPPLVVLAHKSLSSDAGLRKWIYRLLPYSILLMLVFRLLLFFPGWIKDSRLNQELSGYKEWARELKKAADGRPLVFSERYQRVSSYAFYSEDSLLFTINPTQKSDFDFMDYEERIQGKDVLFAARYHFAPAMDSIETSKGIWFLKEIPDFRSYKKFRFLISEEETIGDSLRLRLSPENPYPWPVTFNENPSMAAWLGYAIYKDGEVVKKDTNLYPAADFSKGGVFILPVSTLEKGEYSLIITLKTGWLPEYTLSRVFDFSINLVP